MGFRIELNISNPIHSSSHSRVVIIDKSIWIENGGRFLKTIVFIVTKTSGGAEKLIYVIK